MIFATVWKTFRRIVFISGVLLSFVLGVELFRIYIFFDRYSTTAAQVYVGCLAIFLLAGLFYIWRGMGRYPRALRPPPLPPLDEATHQELKRYARYLIAYMRRLSRNRNLSEEEAARLLDEIDSMHGLLNHHPLNEDLIRIIEKTDTEVLPPVLKSLKNRAEKEIRRSVRDVMLGVTLSPYHSVDILIVLYRNFAMIFRVMAVYETRPAPRAQLRILRDVLRVIATVNLLYVGRNLIENLFSFIPWVGRVADDIGQGLGAGLFTSAAGHAVIDRCSTYHEWEKDAAVESLAAQTRDFLRDVKNIFTKDVLPDIKNRILSEAPQEKVREPGFWDNLQNGVNNAFDATIRTVGGMIPKMTAAAEPLPAGGPIRQPAGRVPERPSPEPEERTRNGKRRHRRSRQRHGVSRVLHTFGQRIKYTFGIGRSH
jgi:uncharacterized membrane protein YcjF (UPF0283 family)